MNYFGQILKLTTIGVILTAGLFAFILVNVDRFQGPELLGCGTTATLSDVDNSSYGFSPDHAGLKLFNDNCRACHQLDQKLVGPALRYSFATRDSVWFVKMIVSANGLIASGDTLALRLFNNYNQTRHPDFEGLSKKELTDLVEYLKLEGEREIIVD